MVWCSYCAKDQETENDDINGFTCCTGCGRVLDDNVYSSDPTFTKSADGQSQLQGNFVKDRQYSSYGRLGGSGNQGYGFVTDSHEKTLDKGRNEIRDIADFLAISGKEDAVGAAHRLYTLAVERNFTRGRRTNQVAAACLYIICRQDQKPFLLIDFSDFLQTNVYVLGAVFLQLCRLLSLEQHPIMQKPVDPSLFIHRFTDRLVGKSTGHGKKFHSIANTALRLVASMKRDWLQTGRRPSGICGAALFISAHIHGFECTKIDVVSVVHVCEATLKKRLVEFEKTESGSLTAEEFEARAKEIELQSQTTEASLSRSKDKSEKSQLEVVCEHKELGAAHFALGLCKSCYEEFVRVSGGLEGGAAPPAFQCAELKRMEAVRKQMHEQGLLSDDEDELRNAESVSGKDRIKRGRGRSKGKKEKQMEDGSIEADGTMDQIPGRGRGRGRRKGRGLRKAGEEGVIVAEHDIAVSFNQGQAESGDALAELSQDYLEEEHPVIEKSASPCIEKEMETCPTRHGLSERPAVDEFQNVECSCPDADIVKFQTPCANESGEKSEASVTKSFPLHGIKEAIPNAVDSCITDSGQAENVNLEQSCLDEAAKDDELLPDDGDTFSDIDDNEVDGYLHNQEEVRLKTIIWTEMNKDYLEEQQAKHDALVASQAAHAAALAAAGTDSASAVELAAAAAAAVAELKKDRKRKRAEAKNKVPAESATEATRQMLQTKRFSSKVNYNALEKLFDGEDATEAVNGGGNYKVKDDDKGANDVKEKHVKWAEGVVTDDPGNLQKAKITTDQVVLNEEGISKDDIEEDEDFSDGDNVIVEDKDVSSYRLPYGEEYGDDEYDEY